jgi:hypothetical protein
VVLDPLAGEEKPWKGASSARLVIKPGVDLRRMEFGRTTGICA